MIKHETDFQILYDDLRSSVRLASKNLLSFILGVVGIGIVLSIVIAAVALTWILAIFVWQGNSFLAFGTFMSQWGTAMSDYMSVFATAPVNAMMFGLAGLLLLIPAVAVLFIWIGPLYGMSKEVVESGSTHAESALGWLRNRFFHFALAGVLMSLIIAGPPIVLYSGLSTLYGTSLTGWPSALAASGTFLWVFFTYGLLSTWLPAIADGATVEAGLRTSLNLARQHFPRIYGLLTEFLVVILIVIGPISLWGFYQATHYSLSWILPSSVILNPVAIWLMIYTVLGALVLVFIALPAHIVAYTRVYTILSGKELPTETPDVPDIGFMGVI